MDFDEVARVQVLQKPYCGSKYIAVDDGRLLNEDHIIWIRKVEECMRLCAKPVGCSPLETHSVCKAVQPRSYDRLSKLFLEKPDSKSS
jgi:hypothetical protein